MSAFKDKISLDQAVTFDLIHTDYSVSQHFSTGGLQKWLKKGYLYHYLSLHFFWTLAKRCATDFLFFRGLVKIVYRQGIYVWKSIMNAEKEMELRKSKRFQPTPVKVS